MHIHLLHPGVDISEALLGRAVVCEDYALSATIVGLGDCAESLLAGSIPDLHLDRLSVQLDDIDFEVDPYDFVKKVKLTDS